VQPQPKNFIVPDEYLRLEREANTKSEYWNGEIYAMAGASEAHNAIVVNLVLGLGPQVRVKACRIYSSDMRVKVHATGLYTYPDIVIVCGRPQFEDRQQDTLLNPTLIIEVLSRSTAAYDRTTKFDHYRTLESLTDYVLVAQSQPMVQHYARRPDGKWLLSDYRTLDAVAHFASIDCNLSLSAVYEKVEWPEDEAEPPKLRVVKDPGVEYASYPGDLF